jgi:hypothetical protein
MAQVLRDLYRPERKRVQRLGCMALAVLVAAAGGFAGGNLSPRVVGPGWERLMGIGQATQTPAAAEAPANRLGDVLTRVRAQEEHWNRRHQGLHADLDAKRRALHLMKTQGRDPAAWPRLQTQLDQLRHDLDDTAHLLAEITGVREGLEKLQDRAGAGPGAREWDDLEEIVIRARRLLETRGMGPGLDPSE